MTYRGHAVGGLVSAALVYQVAPAPGLFSLAAMALAGLMGGWMPDLDAPGAKMSRKVWPLPWLIYMVLYNPLTWAGAGMGRVEGSSLREPPKRYPLRAWFVSRWIVQLFLGREHCEQLFRKYNGHRKPMPLALRLFWNPLVRALLGRERALRLLHHMSAGRARMRTLAGHRGISHTWVVALFCSLLFVPVALWVSRGMMALWIYVFGVSEGAPAPGGALGDLPPDLGFAIVLVLCFGVGYLSHILLDSGSRSGTRPHWPLSNRKFWILPERLRYVTAR